MQQRGRSGSVAYYAAERQPAVVTVGLIALDLNLLVTALTVAGYRIAIPFNILAGFSFNLGLLPVMTALIVAFALWRYGGVSLSSGWLFAHLLFVVPVAVSFIVNYLTGVLLMHLSDAAVTNASNFYFVLFLKSAFSAASVLLVAAIASSAFRTWPVWLYLIVIWGGGDCLLFFGYGREWYTRDIYQWLYPIERTLGFMLIAYQLQTHPRGAAS